MLIKFKVLRQPWTLRLLDNAAYKKKNGRDSVAITKMHKRRIDLSPRGFDLETIVHELLHAYSHELCVSSMDVEKENLEEFYAELMAKRGYELLDLANGLYKKIQWILDKRRGNEL